MSSDSAALHSLQPDAFEPRPEEVERYVEALRELASSDPGLARRQAWQQIRLAGGRAGSRPGEAHDTLNRMFRLGEPPTTPLDGFHEGILVTTTTMRASDPALRLLARAWMPWAGKSFDARTETGENVLQRAAKLPASLIWPGYRMWDVEEGRLGAFRFRTHTDPGRDDPDRQTLKIDYDWDENPRRLIRDILDELVEIVPGAYLGKIMLRRGEHWQLIGYFALQPPETVRVEERSAARIAVEPAPAPA